ncbi:ribosomal protein L6 [Thermocrinis albus DSM 14484]|uniref:Large ribosomal subunit protein uL6 n=1 Tax=Thermocrinis albus (strain DSM 14484 / JCM 11386 / HI 11/12) TaxID=638303 RepID=D3SQF1_THEAH|nr:50S ribosomal protein L6 [Thermocrinis albus]ADC89388.1 ribosomal protein L6 [Thermocrinis albus DSM 14484]
MSRIGKKPIEIPQNVKVNLEGNKLTVEGPKGKLSLDVHPDITVKLEDGHIKLERPSDAPFHRAIHGTMGALIRNMIKGVTEGYTVVLEVVGLGYRAAVKGNTLELNLGYSHPVLYQIPPDVKIEVKENKIYVSGIDKQRVGQVAAEIRSFRKPDPYKGKGIRYEGEVLKLKPGKAAGKGKK